LPPGSYTLLGKHSGIAKTRIVKDLLLDMIKMVSVEYSNFSDDGKHYLHGHEAVTLELSASDPWLNHIDWYSDILQTGATNASKKTSPDGFHLTINALENIFEANGTLTTILNGVVYKQPLNGA
jgi:hypothetical protein